MTEQKTALDCPLFDYIHRKLTNDQFEHDATDFKSLMSLRGFDTNMRNFILKLYHQKLISPAQRRYLDHGRHEETNIRLLSKLEELYLNSNVINARNLLTNNLGNDKFITKFYYVLFTVYASCVNSAMFSNKILAWPHLIFSFNITIKKIISSNNRFKENLLKKIEDNLISVSLLSSLNRIV